MDKARHQAVRRVWARLLFDRRRSIPFAKGDHVYPKLNHAKQRLDRAVIAENGSRSGIYEKQRRRAVRRPQLKYLKLLISQECLLIPFFTDTLKSRY